MQTIVRIQGQTKKHTLASSSIDIIALTETKLGLEINTGELNIRCFQLFRKDRNDQGGRIAVYLRNELQVTVINIESPSEAVLLKIQTGKGTSFLLIVYRPPSNADPLMIPTLFDEINDIINLVYHVIVCGD